MRQMSIPIPAGVEFPQALFGVCLNTESVLYLEIDDTIQFLTSLLSSSTKHDGYYSANTCAGGDPKHDSRSEVLDRAC